MEHSGESTWLPTPLKTVEAASVRGPCGSSTAGLTVAGGGPETGHAGRPGARLLLRGLLLVGRGLDGQARPRGRDSARRHRPVARGSNCA